MVGSTRQVGGGVWGSCFRERDQNVLRFRCPSGRKFQPLSFWRARRASLGLLDVRGMPWTDAEQAGVGARGPLKHCGGKLSAHITSQFQVTAQCLKDGSKILSRYLGQGIFWSEGLWGAGLRGPVTVCLGRWGALQRCLEAASLSPFNASHLVDGAQDGEARAAQNGECSSLSLSSWSNTFPQVFHLAHLKGMFGVSVSCLGGALGTGAK